MKKLRKVSIAIGLCAMLIVSIFAVSANATVNESRISTCCDRMSTYTYESKENARYSRCYTGHIQTCRLVTYDHYRIKKCYNCNAVHSKTYSKMSSTHTSFNN